MKPETADLWLDRAVDEKWSASQLRERISQAKEVTATEAEGKPRRGRPRKVVMLIKPGDLQRIQRQPPSVAAEAAAQPEPIIRDKSLAIKR